MPKPPSSNRSIRLPDAEWARLQKEADGLGISVNALIARYVAVKERPSLNVEAAHREIAARYPKALGALAKSEAPFRGLTASGEALPERRATPKGATK